jgi:hypothetical protein
MEKGEYKVNENVITINGTEYNPNDLSDQQRYWMSQIHDLQAKRQSTQFQLDQISVALDSFTNVLIESLSNNEQKEQTNG